MGGRVARKVWQLHALLPQRCSPAARSRRRCPGRPCLWPLDLQHATRSRGPQGAQPQAVLRSRPPRRPIGLKGRDGEGMRSFGSNSYERGLASSLRGDPPRAQRPPRFPKRRVSRTSILHAARASTAWQDPALAAAPPANPCPPEDRRPSSRCSSPQSTFDS